MFGDCFVFSNCRQLRNNKLRQLAPGSVVLFGSNLSGGFVLDSVFVVGEDNEEYIVNQSEAVNCEPAVQHIVFEPLRAGADRHLLAARFHLYRGTGYAERPEGPFSFVPCQPYATDPQGFSRPMIILDNKRLTPGLAMAAKVTPATTDELRDLWDEVRRQVLTKGLAVAVHIEMPPQRFAPT